MAYTLHPAVVSEARRLFHPREVEYVLATLANTELPLDRGGPPPRIHLAVIWLSKGERRRFHQQMEGGRLDWRDTLVAAGLANEDWRLILSQRGIDTRDW